MFPASKITAFWSGLILVATLVIVTMVGMSIRDLDRTDYPIPVENR